MPLEIRPKGKYIRERLRDPSHFQKGSLRTIKQGSHRIIIGRPRGKSTTEAQAILHPLRESGRFRGLLRRAKR